MLNNPYLIPIPKYNNVNIKWDDFMKETKEKRLRENESEKHYFDYCNVINTLLNYTTQYPKHNKVVSIINNLIPQLLQNVPIHTDEGPKYASHFEEIANKTLLGKK